jgi:copper transport protein
VLLSAALQLVVLGRDLGGGLGDAIDTQVGWALLLRILAALIVIGAFELGMRTSTQGDLAALMGMTAVLAATWAYAGHARSQRWPVVGVALDVGHTLGALTWLGGLLAIVRLTRRHHDHGEMVGVMQRFSDIAKTSVVLIAVTGVLQSLRIDGWPWQLASTTHGRVLLAKLVVVGVLLYVANVNRQRVAARFRRSDSVTAGSLIAVRRAVTTEVVVSAVVLALTAALVASSAR